MPESIKDIPETYRDFLNLSWHCVFSVFVNCDIIRTE